MRQLEELNLVDDFLVNSLTSHQVYGEPAARCILECILGRKIGRLKVIPQHFVQGEERVRFFSTQRERKGIRRRTYAGSCITWSIRQRRMQGRRGCKNCMKW